MQAVLPSRCNRAKERRMNKHEHERRETEMSKREADMNHHKPKTHKKVTVSFTNLAFEEGEKFIRQFKFNF